MSLRKRKKIRDRIHHYDRGDNQNESMPSLIVLMAELLLLNTRQQASTMVVDYHIEKEGLRSFETWPVLFLEPAKFAAAGFYYRGEGDTVRCFECKLELSQWEKGDNPMADHQRWQEGCCFVQNIPCGNVPIEEDENSMPQWIPKCNNVCGILQNASGQLKPPVNPEYESYDARLGTFKLWPKSIPQTKECLADADFYFTGNGDNTLCYYCGGGLNDWKPNDDPWEEHVKWFPKCHYVRMAKRLVFVNAATGPPILPTRSFEAHSVMPRIEEIQHREGDSADRIPCDDDEKP